MFRNMSKKMLAVVIATVTVGLSAGSADAGWGWRHHHGGSWGSSGSCGSSGSWGSSGSCGSSGSWGSYGGYSHYYGGAPHYWGHGYRHVSPSYYSHGGYWGAPAYSGYVYSSGSWGSSGGSCGSSGGSSGGTVIYDPPAAPAQPMPVDPMPVDPMPGLPGTLLPPAPGGALEGPGSELPPLPNARRSASDSAILAVNVPAEARVYVNGVATNSKGANRQYVSRGLAAGYDYTYQVKVEAIVDGQRVTDTKTVSLRGGDAKLLAFDLKPAAEIATTLTLRVPQDARVELAGRMTNAQGTVRTFTTRALQGDRVWQGYTVRVMVDRNGRTLTQERQIDLQAGKATTLEFDFNAPRLATNR
jgi:uncharacterized protein (TIGR03000 family)